MSPRWAVTATPRRGPGPRLNDDRSPMVFKRRTRRTWRQILADSVWPKGGWLRATSYIWHRLRRLPDPPHRIARGVAAGIFASFTPFYGFHILVAALLTWIMRGNILASLLATFVGNPVTLPFIATLSVELGNRMLGNPDSLPIHQIVGAFSQASLQLWYNVNALFGPQPMHWDRLAELAQTVFLPYLVGGIVPGIVAGMAGYMVSHRVISAYQAARMKRLRRRVEKRRAAAEAAAAGKAAEAGE
jgi:uncharacterized protein (DUF2062 family)